jgi:hypothetical protein
MDKPGIEPARWVLVVGSSQWELFEILRERLDGSGIRVVVERRTRERRRGSLGPPMDRRITDRRRQRPLGLLTPALPGEAGEVSAAAPVEAATNGARLKPITQRCPTCASSIELELPRFPHPPARVDMEVAHVAGTNRRPQHYVEIAAFTVSGRLILSQRVPGRLA